MWCVCARVCVCLFGDLLVPHVVCVDGWVYVRMSVLCLFVCICVFVSVYSIDPTVAFELRFNLPAGSTKCGPILRIVPIFELTKCSKKAEPCQYSKVRLIWCPFQTVDENIILRW